MNMVRLSKLVLIGAMALFAALVTFGNLTDYGTNLVFVEHVLRMDDVFPDARIRYRAIDQPLLHHLAYALIIAGEALTALLCGGGCVAMFRARHADAQGFAHAKRWAIAGLTLGFVVWQVGFMTIGGEWFGMWMSATWNGIDSAFRFYVTLILVLIYLVMEEPA